MIATSYSRIDEPGEQGDLAGMRYYSLDEVRKLLAEAVFDGQKFFAQQHGFGAPYLNDVLKRRREPGPKILDALGLECVKLYRAKPISDQAGDQDGEGT